MTYFDIKTARMVSSFLFSATTIIFLLYIFVQLTWKLWKRRLSFIPSAPNVPWLGSIPYLGGEDSSARHKILQKFAQQFDHLYIWWITGKPIVSIGRVEYAEAVLKSQEMITKSSLVKIFREWLGDGLAFSTGSKWKNRRVSITPAFHFAVLNEFVEIFSKHALKLVDKVMLMSREKESIEVQRLAKLSTLDVICETSMGVTVDALNSDSEYVEAVDKITKYLFKRFSNPVTLFSKTIYQMTSQGRQYYQYLDTIHQFTRKVILDNIAFRNNNNSNNSNNSNNNDNNTNNGSSSSSMDAATTISSTSEQQPDGLRYKRKKVLIDVLLDMYEKGEIDMDGIQEEVDTFMFAGHDTTSTTLSWTLYEIGRNEAIQRKLQEEIAEASFSHSSLIDRVRSLKYMECVIKESLRLHPPVGGIGRELEHDTVINNHTFPAGTILTVDTWSMHLNPAYWPDPHLFNPERFNSKESAKRNPYCFVPFSAGPRNCIGQKYALLEEKVYLYHILSCFDVTSLQTPDEIIVGTEAITYSMNGIHIKFSVKQTNKDEAET